MAQEAWWLCLAILMLGAVGADDVEVFFRRTYEQVGHHAAVGEKLAYSLQPSLTVNWLKLEPSAFMR